MLKKIIFLFVVCNLSQAIGQVKNNEIRKKDNNGFPSIIKLKESKIKSDYNAIISLLKKQYNLSQEESFKPIIDTNQIDNQNPIKFQQFYKNIKVEDAILNVSSFNGYINSINGHYIKPNNVHTKPSIKESEALKILLDKLNAQEYAWQNEKKEKLVKRLKNNDEATYFPKGELVIIQLNESDTGGSFHLAYKFDVYSLKPLERKFYYVEANTGEILLTEPIIKHIEGIGATKYSGQRSIETRQVSGQFRLEDEIRGNGITTYNNYNLGSHSNNHYVDNDNNWSSGEFNNSNNDNAGLDAHWGAMNTYDYFLNTHNRNSIDDNGYELINYVNANLVGFGFTNSDNAFWDGSVMTYGMGTSLNPLVSIDIVGHEIAHGLDQYTSNLTYRRESGAIDEGLADIWGAMIEFYAAPEKDTYTLGEDIGYIFRSMSNPKSRNQPDTYQGDFWISSNCSNPNQTNDYCGVHTNSSILNHWFYLLAEGSSNTDEINDNLDTYSITGIGKLAASKIIFRAQTVYFTPNMTYDDARDLTLMAAEDLYGIGSIEVFATCQSWYAVGVGINSCEVNIELSGSNTICGETQSTYNVIGYIPDEYAWNISSNLEIVTSSNTSITVKPTNQYLNEPAFIELVLPFQTSRKEIFLGPPYTALMGYCENYYDTYCDLNYAGFYFNVGQTTSLRLLGIGTETNGLGYDLDWEWEKLSGDFDFVAYGVHGTGYPQNNGNKSIGSFANIHVNSGSSDISFQTRARNDCGWGYWKFYYYSISSGYYYAVYPNPSSDYFFIEKRTGKKDSFFKEKETKYEIYDLNNQISLRGKIQGKTQIDVSRLTKGIYILKIIEGENIKTHEILIN